MFLNKLRLLQIAPQYCSCTEKYTNDHNIAFFLKKLKAQNNRHQLKIDLLFN